VFVPARSKHIEFTLQGTLNSVRGEPFEQARLVEIFEKWFPHFEKELKSLQEPSTTEMPRRTDGDILEELLALVKECNPRPTMVRELAGYVAPSSAGNVGDPRAMKL
jgi:hypothetical protein